jgi:hypothetical protein
MELKITQVYKWHKRVDCVSVNDNLSMCAMVCKVTNERLFRRYHQK